MKLIDPIVRFQAELQAIRHDLHAHPELNYEEHRTSETVARLLTEWGIPVIRGLGGTGVVGVIRHGTGKKAIGLRADMDALPVQELNRFPHASRHPGKMHACGHDGHTAMLLGAARCLALEPAQIDGTIYLVFQPAEEGGAGGRKMIEDGLFEQCPMDAIYGMHNWPGMPTGKFGVRAGPMMASSSEFTVTVCGKGSHAAQPYKSVDPIPVAAELVLAWQTILSRNVDPNEAAVLSVTQIHAGSATNIIPDQATVIGTVRTFTLEMLDLIERRMREMAHHISAAHGATVEFDFHRNYPPLINHAAETDLVIDVLKNMVGPALLDPDTPASMGAEDFAFMLQHKPGCYVFLGNGNGDHRSAEHGLGPCNLHNASYDFNDDLLSIGASYWVQLARHCLKTTSP